MNWPSSGQAVAVPLQESDASPLPWSVLYRSQRLALHLSVLLLHSYWLQLTHQTTAYTKQDSCLDIKYRVPCSELHRSVGVGKLLIYLWGHWALRRTYHRVCNTCTVQCQTSSYFPGSITLPLGQHSSFHPDAAEGRKLSWPKMLVTWSRCYTHEWTPILVSTWLKFRVTLLKQTIQLVEGHTATLKLHIITYGTKYWIKLSVIPCLECVQTTCIIREKQPWQYHTYDYTQSCVVWLCSIPCHISTS